MTANTTITTAAAFAALNASVTRICDDAVAGRALMATPGTTAAGLQHDREHLLLNTPALFSRRRGNRWQLRDGRACSATTGTVNRLLQPAPATGVIRRIRPVDDYEAYLVVAPVEPAAVVNEADVSSNDGHDRAFDLFASWRDLFRIEELPEAYEIAQAGLLKPTWTTLAPTTMPTMGITSLLMMANVTRGRILSNALQDADESELLKAIEMLDRINAAAAKDRRAAKVLLMGEGWDALDADNDQWAALERRRPDIDFALALRIYTPIPGCVEGLEMTQADGGGCWMLYDVTMLRRAWEMKSLPKGDGLAVAWAQHHRQFVLITNLSATWSQNNVGAVAVLADATQNGTSSIKLTLLKSAAAVGRGVPPATTQPAH